MTPLRIFVSYSHKDQVWFARFRPLLSLYDDSVVAAAWHDDKLDAGTNWEEEIRRQLAQMEIFVCLVSVDFLTSRFIKEVELAIAADRHQKGEIEVVPVLLYPVDLKRHRPFLHELQPLPAFGKTWSQTNNYKNAMSKIGGGLDKVIDRAVARKTAPPAS